MSSRPRNNNELIRKQRPTHARQSIRQPFGGAHRRRVPPPRKHQPKRRRRWLNALESETRRGEKFPPAAQRKEMEMSSIEQPSFVFRKAPPQHVPPHPSMAAVGKRGHKPAARAEQRTNPAKNFLGTPQVLEYVPAKDVVERPLQGRRLEVQVGFENLNVPGKIIGERSRRRHASHCKPAPRQRGTQIAFATAEIENAQPVSAGRKSGKQQRVAAEGFGLERVGASGIRPVSWLGEAFHTGSRTSNAACCPFGGRTPRRLGVGRMVGTAYRSATRRLPSSSSARASGRISRAF